MLAQGYCRLNIGINCKFNQTAKLKFSSCTVKLLPLSVRLQSQLLTNTLRFGSDIAECCSRSLQRYRSANANCTYQQPTCITPARALKPCSSASAANSAYLGIFLHKHILCSICPLWAPRGIQYMNIVYCDSYHRAKSALGFELNALPRIYKRS